MDNDYKQKVDELYEFMNNLKANPSIPYDVAEAFRLRLGTEVPEGLANAPVTKVNDPTGVGTVDTAARAAINSIIDALQTLGLMES